MEGCYMRRLQRKRVKGWRKPENSVIIDRTSKFGNPFKIMGDMIYCDASHRRKILDKWVFFGMPIKGLEQQALVDLHRQWLKGETWDNKVKPCPYTKEEIKKELAGKDLLCFCKEDQPCHGDNLITICK